MRKVQKLPVELTTPHYPTFALIILSVSLLERCHPGSYYSWAKSIIYNKHERSPVPDSS